MRIHRLLLSALSLPGLLFTGLVARPLAAQEVPGLVATLQAPRTTVAALGTVELRLVLQIAADTEVPAALLSGADLVTTVDDKPGPAIREEGHGGPVHLLAGTRIERTLQLPVARLVPNPPAADTAVVTVAWRDLAGVKVQVRVVPDASKIDIAKLDLTKTKVVLITSLGDMTLAFRPDKAPATVENFVKLAKSGFYDGTKIHRVSRNFMIQGGDPFTKEESRRREWGSGGPGYKINAEISDLRHTRGILSMARGTDINSAGSQFFIMHRDVPQLDGQYTSFGQLEAGADVLDRIANVPCGGPKGETPLQDIVVESAVVLPVLKK